MNVYRGVVRGGVVVFHDNLQLPEGTEVLVTLIPAEQTTENAAPAIDPGHSIWQKLAELGRWAESQPCDLPEDLAANHDHYLHGLPKRQ